MYELQVVGKLLNSDSILINPEIISYNKKNYKFVNGTGDSLLNFSDIQELITNARKLPDLALEEKIFQHNPDNPYLVLYFCPEKQEQVFGRCHQLKLRILSCFFNIKVDRDCDLKNLKGDDDDWEDWKEFMKDKDYALTQSNEIQNLYERIRQAHREENKLCSTVPNEITHTFLTPILRPYQSAAVKWMINREITQKTLPSGYKPVKSRGHNYCFYYCSQTGRLLDYDPGDIEIPTGGMLADEMGLGKTVELLALILLNRRSTSIEVIHNDMDSEANVDDNRLTNKIVCFCRNRENSNDLIQCSICNTSQHLRCVAKERQHENYKCPKCWLFYRVKSSATFIVSPPSIKMQWKSEIQKHIRSDSEFRVFMYDGIKAAGWIDPYELANYDIVITDYNIMRSELYFDQNNLRERSTRTAVTTISPVSPLTLIEWWRVCLDEAQMVQTPTNNCAKMVRSIPAVHRWSVTGTPIEKSIDNLYGSIYFLGYKPYTDKIVWERLANSFREGNIDLLVNALKNIFWRTCKSTVLDQIDIPPQREIIHYVDMSDLQSYFYNTQHEECATRFSVTAHRLQRSLSMRKMDAHTLKLIMEPLRKLRQDATAPSIYQQRSDQTSTKIFLNPDELHKHIVNYKEIEIKTDLRTIASSMNGLAALSLEQGKLDDAENWYKSVLRYAKDYTGTICVDSLLQIHALHNWLDVLRIVNPVSTCENNDIRKELEQLELKYIDPYNKLVTSIKTQLNELEKKLLDIEGDFDDLSGGWYREYFATTTKDELIIKRANETLCEYNSSHDKFYATRVIDYFLYTWLNKLDAEHKNVNKSFQKLSMFYENIKPKYQLSTEVEFQINKLIKSAFDCHLSNNWYKNPYKKIKLECQLCIVKSVLDKYECVIFDKVARNDYNQGSWRPSLEEAILRSIHTSVKREDSELADEGEKHLQYLDCLKNQFKVYSKFWVEINYTVSIYDELNMCKSRLRIVDPNLYPNIEQSKLIVSKYDVVNMQMELKDDLRQAEIGFQRKQATLKYLKHLEKKETEIDVCPVCKKVPDTRYSVWDCGHHLCMICLAQMSKIQRRLVCCICRQEQKLKDIYYVTLKKAPNLDSINVHGQHSEKILEIVRTTISLIQEDDQVKIIIFSHWENILQLISNALKQNFIKFVIKSTDFQKSLNLFKDISKGITCFLLPLSYGAKGLNLIEATHVFLVEPILNPSEELQAIGRVHRIGQNRPTFVHRFITRQTIEEKIFNTISNDKTNMWKTKNVTVENLENLFNLKHDLELPNDLSDAS